MAGSWDGSLVFVMMGSDDKWQTGDGGLGSQHSQVSLWFSHRHADMFALP